MCESIANGGRRCAAHTRPAYQQALGNALSYGLGVDSYMNSTFTEIPARVIGELMGACFDYASTPSGNKDIIDEIAKLESNSDFDVVTEILKVARDKGKENMDSHDQLQKEIKVHLKALEEQHSPLKAVEGAIALGAKVSAPIGSTVFEVAIRTYYDGESSDFHLGTYPSKEVAQEALAKYIVRQWYEVGLSAPWHNDKPNGKDFYLDDPQDQALWTQCKDKFLEGKSNLDIIDYYFKTQWNSFNGDLIMTETKISAG